MKSSSPKASKIQAFSEVSMAGMYFLWFLTLGALLTQWLSAQQNFTNFQAASLVIGQPDFNSQIATASQAVTPGPTSVAISSTGKMAVGEQRGRRILIWNSVPSSNGTPADVVLGQADFTSTVGGLSATQSGAIEGVTFTPDGMRLIACDATNNRVLIWNSIPTSNGQAADVVIGQDNFTSRDSGTAANRLSYPAGVVVSLDGKLIVSDRWNNRVLVFNSVPTTNGASADLVIGQTDMTSGASSNTAAGLILPWQCAVSADGKLLITQEQNNRISVFNSIPTTNGAAADVVIGQSAFGIGGGSTAVNGIFLPVGVAISPSGKLAIGEFGNHRVLIFNSIPTVNGASADVVFGQPDFTSNTSFNGGVGAQSMTGAYQMAFAPDGRLFVPGRDMRRVMVFGNDSPPATAPVVVTPTVTGVGVSSAILGGNVTSDGGAPLISRGVVFSPTATNANPQLGGPGVTTLSADNALGIFTVNSPGLAAGTAYSFAAYATNSVGSGHSATGSFTTLSLPDIALEQPVGNNLTNGVSTANFGAVGSGKVSDLQFVVHNTGAGPLTGVSVEITGVDATSFSVTIPPSTTVAAGGSTNMTIRFSPSAIGVRNAVLTLGSNDPDENPFEINLTGSGADLLEASLDVSGWTWSNTGFGEWFGQSVVTHDGIDAAQSGPVAHNQYNQMQATATGPGTLSFWWKVSSERNYDFLEFYIDGALQKGRISGEQDWRQQTFTVESGTHTFMWRYVKDGSNTEGSDTAWVDQVVWETSTLQVAEALDTPGWEWANVGYGAWYGQSATHHDGVDAAQSGPVAANQYNQMQATVTGPGSVSFWWKVSSEKNYDFLEFHIDNVLQKGRISGEAGWQQQTFTIEPGSHTLSWRYIKDGSGQSGADSAWVDQVVWSPTATPLADALDMPGWEWSNVGYGTWFGQTSVTHDGIDAAQSGPVAANQYNQMQATVTGPGSVSFWWKVSSEEDYDFLEFHIDNVLQKGRISGEAGWLQQTYTIEPGSHTLSWRYIKDGSGQGGADSAWVDQVVWSPSAIPLAEALDTPGWEWSNLGYGTWFGQSSVTHDGIDAARSGPIAAYQYNQMQATVTGPGSVSFWWKVSSEEGYDFLEFHIDNVLQRGRISGEAGWQQQTFTIEPGSHTLSWRYIKDGSGQSGADSALVDQVVWSPSAIPLADALDTPGWEWSNVGYGTWFGQTSVTQDAVDAARSGPITSSQYNQMQATVTGPGPLSFWWKVSSEANYDFLEFYIDNVLQKGRISGEIGWQKQTFNIEVGVHTLAWRYVKDGAIEGGSDSAWVDRIVWGTAGAYATWAASVFSPAQMTDLLVSGSNADPNKDGVSNLLHYAFNIPPLQPGPMYLEPGSGTSGLPSIRQVESFATGGKVLRIEYLRRKASSNPDLIYRPQFSFNLQVWEDFTGLQTTESIDGVWERVYVWDDALDEPKTRFGRVKVSLDVSGQ